MRRPVRSEIRLSAHHSWKLRTWSSASEVSGASSASTRLRMDVLRPRLGCLVTSGPLNDRASHKEKGPPGVQRALDGPGIPLSRAGVILGRYEVNPAVVVSTPENGVYLVVCCPRRANLTRPEIIMAVGGVKPEAT